MANVKFTDLPNLATITANTIIPVVESDVNYTVTGANLLSYTSNVASISATGNISGAFFIGNGSQLTGLPASYSNANVTTLLAAFGSNSISTTGTVTSGNVNAVSVAGNSISAGTVVANTISSGNINASNANATILTATTISASGNVRGGNLNTAGNVTASFLLGNISAATGGYSNANVQAVLQTYSGTLTAGSISATGNVAGAFFQGNGSQLTGITASLSGNLVGNINGNGFSITNIQNLTATGNISGTHFGSGSNLTGIPVSISAGAGISVSGPTGAVTITNNNPNPYANANVAAYLPTYSGVVTASTVSATGNITGANITGRHFGNGASLSNIVTSITAGSGISINSSTGAVTITATGGGSADSISNGTTNIRITGVNGNILANVGPYANVANISAGNLTPYPQVTLQSGVSIKSQAGGSNPTFPFDGGLLTDGSVVVGGNLSVNGLGGIFTRNLEASVSITTPNSVTGNFITANNSFFSPLTTVVQGSSGSPGQIRWDTNYIYICVAGNTWKRVALSSY